MAILDAVSQWGTFALSWVSGVAAVASAVVARRVYLSETSPDVILYVEPQREGSHMAMLTMRNIGRAPAYDVSVELSGPLPESVVRNPVPMLAPGASRSVYLGLFPDLIGAGAPAVSAMVSYCSRRGGRGASARYPVEVASFSGCAAPKSVVEHGLGEVAKQVKGVAGELKSARRGGA